MDRWLALCDAIQSIVARDPGRRGIASLVCSGDLPSAARAFIASRNVLSLTGFPCLLSHSPPTETDGLSGAVAVARCALALGKGAAIATDECNSAVLRAALASGLGTEGAELHVFPASSSGAWGEHGAERARLLALAARFDHAVAVERAGLCARDGCSYRTMRGFDMAALVAPLDDLLTLGCACGVGGCGGETSGGVTRTSTGVGDGGNEAGMGRVLARVVADVPLGADIASRTPADALIVAGVSNWGAWGLLAAVEAALRMGVIGGEAALAQALADVGARDGVSAQLLPPGSVDGMPLATHLAMLAELRELVRGAAPLAV